MRYNEISMSAAPEPSVPAEVASAEAFIDGGIESSNLRGSSLSVQKLDPCQELLMQISKVYDLSAQVTYLLDEVQGLVRSNSGSKNPSKRK